MRLPRAARLTIFIVVVLGVVAGIAFGVTALLGLNKEAGDAERVKAETGEEILRFGNGYLATNGLTVRCFGKDNRADALWAYSADSHERTVTASAELVAMYRDDSLHIIDGGDGTVKYSGVMDGRIELVRCGADSVAVYLPDQEIVRVISPSGARIDDIASDGAQMIDMGFFGEDLLWMTFLKKDTTTPSTQLKTYQPGKRETGGYAFEDQLIYDVRYCNNMLYAIGTRDVNMVNMTTGEMLTKKPLVYGWQLIDSAQYNSGKDIAMLFTLTGESASGSPKRLKLILGDGSEQEINLPAGCIGAFVGTKGIYGVAKEVVYSAPFSGAMTEHAFKEAIDEAIILLEGNRLMVRIGDEMRMIDLPS